MAFHAKLSASSSKRWMSCPGCLMLEEKLKHIIREKEPAEAAMEGTCAHALGEECLLSGNEAKDYVGQTIYIDNKGDGVFAEEGNVPEISSYSVEVDIEFAEQVQVYVDYCHSLTDNAKGGAEVAVERYLEMKHVHPDLGGTADFIIAQPFGTLEVVDLKFGKGVMVEVDNNTQLQIYALGALYYYPDCEDVKVTIVQPRKMHSDGQIRSVAYTLEELKAFKSELILACSKTTDENMQLSCGDWCTWCPCLAHCEEVAEVACDLARLDFSDLESKPEPVEFDRLAQVLPFVKILDKWLSSIKATAQAEAENGNTIPGYKLVEGRKGNRTFIVSMDSVIRRMNKLGFKKKDVCKEPELLTPAQMEKLGEGEVREKVKKLMKDPKVVNQKPGGLTLVPVSDPREEVTVRPLVDEFEEANAKAAEDALGDLL